ncbi:MAG: phosphodiesterase [Bacteroidales bacterium]|nr:phosphodiesterase [Bacteroidales bacterium]
MRFLIFSDIHGSIDSVKKIIQIFECSNFDKMIILGDILYHGPRNAIPEGYNPMETANILNKYYDRIIAVRGNCEAEVDQMLLKFPCMGDYATVFADGKQIFATHGHIYNPSNMLSLPKDSIFLYGHTHIFENKKIDGITICNPGSITLPKNGNSPTYSIIDNGVVSVYEL